MSLSLLEALESEQFDTALFLTYTLNLQFFENLVLPRLRRMGATQIGILADHTGYAETLHGPRLPDECGRSYIVAPLRLRRGGIQHAKAIWLSGSQQRVLVGSHNLTMSGFNDQIEVTTELRSDVAEHAAALSDLHNALSEIMPPALQGVWGRVPKPRPVRVTGDTDVRAMTSLHESLEDQLLRRVGRVEQLRVVTPFLSEDQLARLVEGTGAHKVILDLPHEGLDIPLIRAFQCVPTLEARTVHDPGKRRLHAKGYEFRSGDVRWAAIGSANCTNAALAKSVDQGGNLEFLVMARDAVLAEELAFEKVDDPARVPSTHRSWNEGRVGSALMITRAEYKNPELYVEWEVAEQHKTSLADLTVGELTFPDVVSPMVSVLDQSPPGYLTLTALVGENILEASAWIINHDALAHAAQSMHVHRWAEHMSSHNPLQLARSIDLWIAQYLSHELHSGQTDDMPAAISGTANSVATHTPKMRDFHEIFAYSTDDMKVRRAAEQLLAGPKGDDPIATLRALYARMSNAGENDQAARGGEDADSQEAQSRYARAQRERSIGEQRSVESLIRHVNALARESNTWTTTLPPKAVEVIRLTTSVVAFVGYQFVHTGKVAGRRIHLVDAFSELAQAIERNPIILTSLAVRCPFILSLAVVGDIAKQLGRQTEHDRLARIARKVSGADPRAILDEWRIQYPEQIDTLLSRANDYELFEPLTQLAEQLVGIPAPYIQSRIREKWGLLIELHRADMQRLPNRNALNSQAADRYAGSEVWDQYQRRRARGVFPVIVQAQNGRCPHCGLMLSLADSRTLNSGEPVYTACRHILVLRG